MKAFLALNERIRAKNQKPEDIEHLVPPATNQDILRQARTLQPQQISP